MTRDADVTGLLVMAYGTPEREEDIRPYLTHIRHGHEPSDEAVEDLANRYRQIGGPSPLYRTTVDQMKALEARLNEEGGDYRAYLGMKHWHPYIPEAVERMAGDGVRRAVAITLAPHYSTMSIAQYLDFIQQGLAGLERPIEFTCVKSYYDEPLLIDALAEKLRDTLDRLPEEKRSAATVVFTAHSLPEKILKVNDPYREQLLTTARLIAERFEDLEWTFAFTSQGETQDRWLGPTLSETFDELAAQGRRVVVAETVGFVSEHLETLYDFDVEGKEDAEVRGLEFYRAPALDTSPTFIAALAAVVERARSGGHPETARLPGGREIEAPTYPTYA